MDLLVQVRQAYRVRIVALKTVLICHMCLMCHLICHTASIGGRVVKALDHESQGYKFKPLLDRDSHRRYTLEQGDH
jgi:hypothetical protein